MAEIPLDGLEKDLQISEPPFSSPQENFESESAPSPPPENFNSELSSWIRVHEKSTLSEVRKIHDDRELAHRIFTIVDEVAFDPDNTSSWREKLAFNKSAKLSYEGLNIWMYRPRRIRVPAWFEDFQDEHIFIAIGADDWSTDKACDFAEHLVEKLRSDKLTDGQKAAHRTLVHKAEYAFAGAVKLSSARSHDAHSVNVEVLVWFMARAPEVHWSRFRRIKSSKALPGESPSTVRLLLGHDSETTSYRILKEANEELLPWTTYLETVRFNRREIDEELAPVSSTDEGFDKDRRRHL